nr:LexA family transcriptional regulator [uncultured Vibrio sp.]
MNTKKEVGLRLKKFREQLGISQRALADKCGWIPSRIGNYEAGVRSLSIDDAEVLASQLGVSAVEIMFDVSNSGNISIPSTQPETKGSFPLISSVQAGQWREACEPYNVKDAHMLATTEKASASSFWLTVEGDSMTAPPGSPLSFPTGVRVLVDPELEAINKSLVVAKLDDVNEATFKQLIVDAGQKFLNPLNPTYPKLPINGNCKIIGVVVDAKLKLS